jgi:hypothetical protein
MMPVSLPTGSSSLPPLGGRLLAAYRVIWWALLAAAVASTSYSLFDPGSHSLILTLRLAKSVVLVAVAAILFRRRQRDPVAAMLGQSFLLWTISSSADFIGPADAAWPILLDQLRFLPFALALLLFPNGEWQPRRTEPIAAAIFAVFVVGAAEALGLLATRLYLPLAIGCVLAALTSLLARYRSQPVIAQQQLKWVTLGLVIGIGLILSARAGAAIALPSPMSMAGNVLLETLFQLGIVVIALGFLTSLLRYRLYDAEAAISRSAAYAGLTLALVATFAASEAVIQTLGQRYFGPGVGDLSGGIAAAIAAVLLTPLHSRISDWAEQYFQHDLAIMKRDLPDLLTALSAGASVKHVARTVLPRIERALQATRVAMAVDGKLVASQGIGASTARNHLRNLNLPILDGPLDHIDDEVFPLRVALRCPLGSVRGWLLLGPRPDGSFFGKDDLDAISEIVPALQRNLFLVAEREATERRRGQAERGVRLNLSALARRIDLLEREARHAALLSIQ